LSDHQAHHTGGYTFILARTVVYATLFIGLVLVFLPARVLSWAGIARPETLGALQVAGIVVGAAGVLLTIWCIGTFVAFGHGTPAPFDPPRRLVLRGPYRYIRNPMYLGEGVAIIGLSLFFETWALAGYAVLFLLAFHFFVMFYEEPTLRATFGESYQRYCEQVGRWWPTDRRA
jgi:protein-S-isoprenylcysteine O-methyltransferase Ste14